MTRTALFVGEDYGHSPSKYHRDMYALTGASGRYLARLAGLHPLDFYLATDRTNVVELPEQWKNKDLVAYNVLDLRHVMSGRTTVLLGRKVARAFGILDLSPFTWHDFERGGTFAVMPHPSGRNRFWNDPMNVALAMTFMRKLFDE